MRRPNYIPEPKEYDREKGDDPSPEEVAEYMASKPPAIPPPHVQAIIDRIHQRTEA